MHDTMYVCMLYASAPVTNDAPDDRLLYMTLTNWSILCNLKVDLTPIVGIAVGGGWQADGDSPSCHGKHGA